MCNAYVCVAQSHIFRVMNVPKEDDEFRSKSASNSSKDKPFGSKASIDSTRRGDGWVVNVHYVL